MKRDMDLARRILLDLEENPAANGANSVGVRIEGHDDPEVSYHVMLLADAGLIGATEAASRAGRQWVADNLTWQGHEFLDASRDDTRWNKAKGVVAEKTGGLAFEAIKSVLLKWTADALANVPMPF